MLLNSVLTAGREKQVYLRFTSQLNLLGTFFYYHYYNKIQCYLEKSLWTFSEKLKKLLSW